MKNAPFPPQPIALVVSDVDGTLVTRDKRLTDRTMAAIAALRAHGVAFTIISARPPLGLHKLVERLHLDGPVGAVNGGALIRPDLTIIERKFIEPAAARIAVEFLRENGIDPWLFTETEWYLRDPQGAHVEHESRTLGMAFTIVDDFSDAAYDHALKLVGASHDHEHLAACETALQARLGSTASATRSQAYYLDVTNAAAVKGEGLLGLARLLGLQPDSVMALGDGMNDITMLQRAGFSVAMANASAAVQANAMVVTDDCDADGFAKAVERYVLSDPRILERAAAPPHVHEDLVEPESAAP